MAKNAQPHSFGVPGLGNQDASEVAETLQDRLNALNDLALTLKHVHWNVVGPNFIAVHTMLDPQVDAVRLMVDDTAERIAILGGSPVGTPGALVAGRTWDDYSLGRDDALAHLGALDLVYDGVIEAHRKAIETVGELDPVTEDMLIGQAEQLEQYHWFIRAHLETPSGQLKTSGTHTETEAASRTRKK
ncbi:MAG TPA: DNA starvation/stationary phase protection protein [Streptosporangiaceae bacterium]